MAILSNDKLFTLIRVEFYLFRKYISARLPDTTGRFSKHIAMKPP